LIKSLNLLDSYSTGARTPSKEQFQEEIDRMVPAHAAVLMLGTDEVVIAMLGVSNAFGEVQAKVEAATGGAITVDAWRPVYAERRDEMQESFGSLVTAMREDIPRRE
jgi:hypothetical protein